MRVSQYWGSPMMPVCGASGSDVSHLVFSHFLGYVRIVARAGEVRIEAPYARADSSRLISSMLL
jgi:hypothetical protein